MSKNVKLLLKKSIKNVGRVGDVVEVSAGYARNYLLPQDLAVQPTAGNVKKVEAIRQDIERQERERREQQAALIKQLEGVEVTLERKCQRAGPPVRRRLGHRHRQALCRPRASTSSPTTSTSPAGSTTSTPTSVKVRFAEDLATDIKVWVAPDAESKAAMEAAKKAATAANSRSRPSL